VTFSTVSIEMHSPAHRAALGFLRGGLITAVSLALAPALGALASSVPMLGWLVKGAQFLVPIAGFAGGGALGGDALSLGSRGAMAFGCGGGAAGLVLLLTSPHLQGLTGFEDPLVVVPYAIATSALAFGAMGLIGSLVVRRGKVGRVASVFAVGGIAGGLIGVLPFLAQRWGGSGWADLWVFVTMACSIGSVVVPQMVGGSSAARNWS
jgi:hypothetical protein